MRDSVTTEEYKGYTINTYFDDNPDNPREWSNSSTMLCWHHNYRLGDYDENNYNDPEDFAKQMLAKHPMALRFAAMKLRAGKYENLRLTQDKDVDGDDIWYVEKFKKYYGDDEAQWHCYSEFVYSYDLEDIGRELLEILNFGQLMELLNPYLEWRTISMYEHSGISLWLGSKWSHFDAQWDCSEVGICYCEKEKILKEWPDTTNWREKAGEVMSCEMEVYDKYVQGMVYGFVTTNPDGEDIDSCGGFYEEDEAIQEAKDAIDCDIEREAEKAVERLATLKDVLPKLVGKTLVYGGEAYNISLDMFGFASIHKSKIVKNVLPKYFMKSVNVQDLEKDVQEMMIKAV